MKKRLELLADTGVIPPPAHALRGRGQPVLAKSKGDDYLGCAAAGRHPSGKSLVPRAAEFVGRRKEPVLRDDVLRGLKAAASSGRTTVGRDFKPERRSPERDAAAALGCATQRGQPSFGKLALRRPDGALGREGCECLAQRWLRPLLASPA